MNDSELEGRIAAARAHVDAARRTADPSAMALELHTRARHLVDRIAEIADEIQATPSHDRRGPRWESLIAERSELLVTRDLLSRPIPKPPAARRDRRESAELEVLMAESRTEDAADRARSKKAKAIKTASAGRIASKAADAA